MWGKKSPFGSPFPFPMLGISRMQLLCCIKLTIPYWTRMERGRTNNYQNFAPCNQVCLSTHNFCLKLSQQLHFLQAWSGWKCSSPRSGLWRGKNDSQRPSWGYQRITQIWWWSARDKDKWLFRSERRYFLDKVGSLLADIWEQIETCNRAIKLLWPHWPWCGKVRALCFLSRHQITWVL